LTQATLRVDVLKTAPARSCEEISQLFEEDGPMETSIEVQTLEVQENSLWPKISIMGFYLIRKNTNANMVAKSIGKVAPAAIFIKGAAWWKRVAIEGRHPLYRLLEQLADDRSWKRDRPVLAFQLDSRTAESTK
jgi:hypothetical protein